MIEFDKINSLPIFEFPKSLIFSSKVWHTLVAISGFLTGFRSFVPHFHGPWIGDRVDIRSSLCRASAPVSGRLPVTQRRVWGADPVTAPHQPPGRADREAD